MAHQVFICHSSRDKAVADAACAALEAAGIACWFAPRNVLGGVEYGRAIMGALSNCQIILLIFSRNANDSGQVRREIERAVSKEKIILPFRIENVLPSDAMEYALGNTQWLDAITPPMAQHLSELVLTVEGLLGRHEPEPPPPPTTQRNSYKSDEGMGSEFVGSVKPLEQRTGSLWAALLAETREKIRETAVMPPLPLPASRMALRKDTMIATLLSLFLPAGGQFYNGETTKGLMTLAVYAAGVFLTIFTFGWLAVVNLGVWGWSVVDAYRVARRKAAPSVMSF